MTGSKQDLLVSAVIFLAVAAIGTGVWCVGSHFEAQVFNKLSGTAVSTWDAMWVQLRVTEPIE